MLKGTTMSPPSFKINEAKLIREVKRATLVILLADKFKINPPLLTMLFCLVNLFFLSLYKGSACLSTVFNFMVYISYTVNGFSIPTSSISLFLLTKTIVGSYEAAFSSEICT